MDQTNTENNYPESDRPTTGKKKTMGPVITGLFLVLIGIILLSFEIFGKGIIANFWPFLFIAGGLIFYGVFFIRSKKRTDIEGILFPGTYLIVLGLLFFFLNITSWYYLRYLWPTIIFGTAIALGSMYVAVPKESAKKRQDILSSIKVLTYISAVLYLIAAGGIFLWPLVLVIIGLIIILKGIRKSK